MRKKKIIEQNAILFTNIEELKSKIKDLEEELKAANEQIESLKAENERAKEKETPSSPMETVKEKVVSAVFNAKEYGAKAIGKIVVSASEITSGLSGAKAIEIINLVLGKAEVAKAEILNIVSDDRDDKQKKMTIDSVVEKTRDYFKTAVKKKK